MKTTIKIITFAALLGVLFSCERLSVFEKVDDPAEISGEVPFCLSLGFPGEDFQTKSIVPGLETNVDTLQLLCFDASGLYLGVRTLHKLAEGEEVNEYNEQIVWNPSVSPSTPGTHGVVGSRMSS